MLIESGYSVVWGSSSTHCTAVLLPREPFHAFSGLFFTVWILIVQVHNWRHCKWALVCMWCHSAPGDCTSMIHPSSAAGFWIFQLQITVYLVKWISSMMWVFGCPCKISNIQNSLGLILFCKPLHLKYHHYIKGWQTWFQLRECHCSDGLHKSITNFVNPV